MTVIKSQTAKPAPPLGVRLTRIWGGIVTLLTLLLAAAWVFPMYWAVITSVKPDDETIVAPPTLWPQKFDFRDRKSVV